MERLRLRRPSPAMLVALLALCVALGGTVYAANKINGKLIRRGSEPGNRLKKDTVTGKQVKESSLRTVPNARNATTLGGRSPSAFAASSIEPAHVVGAAGEPPYTDGWAPVGTSNGGIAFFKDPWGIVHLQGNAAHSGTTSASVVFTLPPDYRPALELFPPAYGGSVGPVAINIGRDGAVVVNSPPIDYLGLTGISFRPGVTGLP